MLVCAAERSWNHSKVLKAKRNQGQPCPFPPVTEVPKLGDLFVLQQCVRGKARSLQTSNYSLPHFRLCGSDSQAFLIVGEFSTYM